MKTKLWTKDFTIITLGTVVSMLGNAVSGFALGLMILDYSGSVFFYALTIVVNNLPKIVMPLISGPLLDKYSRRKAIYTLDFISAALYVGIFLMLHFDVFNFALFLAVSFVIGSIDSVYQVAYESFYPNLISEGNFGKAYSISSLLYPFTAMMVPVAAYVYDTVGIKPLFLFNAISFLVAAIFETQISASEKHVEPERFGFKTFAKNLREGFGYIKGEPGLQTVTAYFTVTTLAGAAMSTLLMPYFKAAPHLGIMVYTYCMVCGVFGRMIGGIVHYRYKYPVNKKFAIAMCVYVVITVLEGGMLYLPVPLIMLCQFITGLGGVTSYNIRISATQSYVPDGVRARFNGAFQMLCNAGSIVGSLTAGALADYFSGRDIIAVYMGVNLLAALLIMYRRRATVIPLYNRQV